MSSEAQAAPCGTLAVAGPIGARIRIFDGANRLRGSGADLFEAALEQGLYRVQWIAAGQTSERVVQVHDGGRSDIPPPKANPPDLRIAKLWGALNQERWVAPDGRFDPALVAVIVEPADAADPPIHAPDVMLVNARDEVLPPEDWPSLAGDASAFVWPQVKAGRYRLRFRAVSGELLDQTIPVIGGRRTIIRLKASKATLLVHQETGFVSVPSEGIDAARSAIVSALASESLEDLAERFRLAEILVQDLAAGTGSLSRGFMALLAQPSTDPLLRVCAALVTLNCLGSARSPALDEEWPEDEEPSRQFRKRWRRCAKDLLKDAKRAGMPPDATAALWQAERMKRPRHPRPVDGAFASIQMPPMFECAWRWAIAQSAIDPGALLGFASIRAATRSASGAWPWLCWQAAGAKAVNPDSRSADADELARLITSVAEKTRRLIDSDSEIAALSLHEVLPPEIANTAQQAVAAVTTGDAPRASDLATGVAVSLAMPNIALANRLRRTSELLDEAVDTQPASPQNHALIAETGLFRVDGGAVSPPAPALSRRIKDPEDSNKGRFGGEARVGSFGVEARFEATKSKNWATIYIIVRGDVADGTVAEVFRHDSFKPKMRRAIFENGKARHKATAWGGFTVGIWIPDAQVELELDLSQCANAPRIIRER